MADESNGKGTPSPQDLAMEAEINAELAKGPPFEPVPDQSATNKKEQEPVAPAPATAKLDEADATRKFQGEYESDPEGPRIAPREDTSKDALGEGKDAVGEKFQIVDQSAAIQKEPELVAPDPATAKLDEADATRKLQGEYEDNLGGPRITPREDTAQRHLPNLMIVDEGNGGPPGGGPPPPPPPPPRRPPPDDPGQGSPPLPARPGPSSPEMGAQAKEPPPRSELQPAVSPPSDPLAARSK